MAASLLCSFAALYYVSRLEPWRRLMFSKESHSREHMRQDLSVSSLALLFSVPITAAGVASCTAAGEVRALAATMVSFWASQCTASLVSEVLKVSVGECRPDYYSRRRSADLRKARDRQFLANGMKSFPSGHTAVAFSSATFTSLQKFISGTIHFKVLCPAQSYGRETLLLLVRAKELFQTQLPKMPREYILKQIFDAKHRTMCMFCGEEMVGAICFRMFFEQRFCEVVFLAVDFRSQIRGNGGFMVSLFKEYFKAEVARHGGGLQGGERSVETVASSMICYEALSFPVYLMTYADNSAIGFFKKQGFSRNIRFGGWAGYIKDYEGGTLMECMVYWDINYLSVHGAIDCAKEAVFRGISEEPIYGPISGEDVLLLDEFAWIRKEAVEDIRAHRREKAWENFLDYMLADLSANTAAWPFLQPVCAREVPDYYRVIKRPMDLSEMQRKADAGQYRCLADFESDFFLMINNCYHYNGSTTQYYKCAQNLEAYYHRRVAKHRNKPLIRGLCSSGDAGAAAA
ncbi:UNVERIFIED_CONTAM: hypothetical protein PYX00_011265 [Menopon gallinae]|uniref:Histone acetyltransferase n=1 Tax=Menopon gallinae TaxID=328185 RepID=A0AAW2H735_9NEOP